MKAKYKKARPRTEQSMSVICQLQGNTSYRVCHCSHTSFDQNICMHTTRMVVCRMVRIMLRMVKFTLTTHTSVTLVLIFILVLVLVFINFYSAPLKALYMLRQIRPSVRLFVCLSVTLRYCIKTRERRGMRSSPSGSQCLQFSDAKNG